MSDQEEKKAPVVPTAEEILKTAKEVTEVTTALDQILRPVISAALMSYKTSNAQHDTRTVVFCTTTVLAQEMAAYGIMCGMTKEDLRIVVDKTYEILSQSVASQCTDPNCTSCGTETAITNSGEEDPDKLPN